MFPLHAGWIAVECPATLLALPLFPFPSPPPRTCPHLNIHLPYYPATTNHQPRFNELWKQKPGTGFTSIITNVARIQCPIPNCSSLCGKFLPRIEGSDAHSSLHPRIQMCSDRREVTVGSHGIIGKKKCQGRSTKLSTVTASLRLNAFIQTSSQHTPKSNPTVSIKRPPST